MEKLAQSFTELSERWASPDARLDTAEFAATTAGLGDVLSAVGGPAFGFAGLDLMRKVDSLRDAAAREPSTLDGIVARDKAAGVLRRQGSLGRNAWRVLNAVRFCRELFMGVLPNAEGAPPPDKFSDVVWKAYESTMAATHVYAIRQVVWLAMWAVPSREAFLDNLASHTPGGAPAAEAAARAFIKASEVIIAKLDALYDEPCTDENGI
jgi:hypothetical protein